MTQGSVFSSAENYYELLGLSYSIDTVQISSQDIKQAYRNALLTNHPDKLQQSGVETPQTQPSISKIIKAYTVLSDQEQRDQYDKWLRKTHKHLPPTIIGEIVDLDDFDIHEDETPIRWTRGCRCGHGQGYVVTEDDLLENGDAREISVQCLGCSIWISIQYDEE